MIKNKFKAVIFDLGNVLLKVDFLNGPISLLTGKASDYKNIINELYREQLFTDYNSGRLTPVQFYKEIIHKFDLNIEYKEFTAKWCDIFTPIPGMEQLVIRAAQNCKIGLLSDTDPLHWQHCLEQFPYLQIFERPALSYEIGSLKPAAENYLAAAKNVNTPPAQCIFIDDREQNVIGAREAGMEAIHFIAAEQLKSELRKLQIL